MSINYINTGTSANAGNGDVLRTAFWKVNLNFAEIESIINGGGFGGSIIQSSTPPVTTSTSTLWYDTVGGRTYVYYDDTWVDSSPTADPVNLQSVSTNIVPAVNNTYTLGSPTSQWKEIFVSTGSIYIGNVKLSNLDGQLQVQTVSYDYNTVTNQITTETVVSSYAAPTTVPVFTVTTSLSVTQIVFADDTVQNTAWVGGGSSVVQTNLIFSNDIDTRTFNNTGSVAINFTAYTGGPSFNTEWAYQSPLNDSVGITVLAATVASTATSTSTTTGALTVAGGVGIQGDLWAGNIYSNGVQLTAGGGGSGVTADSTTTFTNKTLNITLGGNDFQIQGNSIYSYSGSGPTLALTQVPTFQGFNFNDSGISGDGGTGVYYWTAGGADGTGTINKAGVLRTAGTSSNALFTFGANGAGTMSVQLDGSLFVGATLPTNSGGLNTDYPGWLVVQSGAKFGGDIDTLGRVLLNGSQFEDDSAVVDFFNVSGAQNNHIVTCHSDWTLKIKARAQGTNQGNLWLEAGQNTKIKVKGNGSNIDIIASDGSSSATWNFAKTGGLQLPSNGSIDFYTGSQTVPYIPGPVLSVYYNEPNSPYYTAFSGSEGIRIPFNTAVSNEGNQYNLATQIYTCPRSGWYSITVSASAVTNNTYYIQLRSGSGDGNIVQQLYGGPPQGNMNGNVLVYLTLNQLYQIRILCGGGLAGEVYGGQYTTYLMMAHIRD